MEATRMRYGRKEAAWKLNLSIRSVDYLIARKVLDTRRDGKRIFITRASLVRYAATNHYGAFAGEKATEAVEADFRETDATEITDLAA